MTLTAAGSGGRGRCDRDEVRGICKGLDRSMPSSLMIIAVAPIRKVPVGMFASTETMSHEGEQESRVFGRKDHVPFLKTGY